MHHSTRDIILASGSAIRRQLLASAGVLFSVEPAQVDEGEIRAKMMTDVPGIKPELVEKLFKIFGLMLITKRSVGRSWLLALVVFLACVPVARTPPFLA